MNNTLKKISYACMIFAMVLIPGLTHADSRSVCKSIKEKENRADFVFDVHNSKLQNTEELFEQNFKDEIDSFEQKRSSQKKNTEEVFRNYISTISSLANTTEKQTALKAYTDGIKKISATRIESIENAQKEYKEGIKKLFNQKKTIERVILNEYKESSKRAFEKSIKDCEKGRSILILKKELKQSIDGGHSRFAQQIRSTTFDQSILVLKATRDQKIQQAQDVFTQKHSELIKTLRATLVQ